MSQGTEYKSHTVDLEEIRRKSAEKLKVKSTKHQDELKINDIGLQYLQKNYVTEPETERILIPLIERAKLTEKIYTSYEIDYKVVQNDPYQGYSLVKATLKTMDGKIHTANGDAVRKDLPYKFQTKVLQCAEHNAKYRVFKELNVPVFLDEITTLKMLDMLEQNDIVKEYRKLLIEWGAKEEPKPAPVINETKIEETKIEVKEESEVIHKKEVIEEIKGTQNKKRKKNIEENVNKVGQVADDKIKKISRGQIKAIRTRLMLVMEKKLDKKVTAAHFVILNQLSREEASYYIQYLDKVIREADLILDATILAEYETKALNFVKKIKINEEKKKGKK